ncbi:MAG: MTAP family purine nucleoside phosphorylase [Candidatus Heimdallarchaeota archaeon]
MRIGVIGGSGFYGFLDNVEEIIIETPFGASSRIELGTVEDIEVVFLQRHGTPGQLKTEHAIPPHEINYRANIYALHELGVTRIIASSAVGIVDDKNGTIKPGTVIIPNQLIDFTPPITFYDGKFTVKMGSGRIGQGVVHVDVTNPICSELRNTFIQAWQKLRGIKSLVPQATYTRLTGPRFETAAEIKALKKLGTTIVGMTMTKEAFLARELEICYASACIATNYAAGLQDKITHEEVIEIFNKQIEMVKEFFRITLTLIPDERKCECSRTLEWAGSEG